MDTGFLHDVADAVAHPEVRGDAPDEPGVHHRVDVGRGPAEPDADGVLLECVGDELDSHPLASRGRHDVDIRPLHQPRIARGVAHDVLHEQLVNRLPRRLGVLDLQDRPEVIDDLEGKVLPEETLSLRPDVLVPREDQREMIGDT